MTIPNFLTIRRNRILLASFALLVGVVAAFGPVVTYVAKLRIAQTLARVGYPDAWVGNITFTPNGLIAETITLDREGFSTIASARVGFGWIDLLTGGDFGDIRLKDVALMAETDGDNRPVLSGWQAPGHLPGHLPFTDLSIDSLTLDLNTPIGALSFEGKLHVKPMPQGGGTLEGALWGQQNQVSLSTTLAANFDPSGNWQATVNLDDGKLRLPPCQASRLGGTASLKGEGTTLTAWRGDLSGGRLLCGNYALSNLLITYQGSSEAYSILGRGQSFTAPDVQFALDMKSSRNKRSPLGTLRIEASDTASLLAFATGQAPKQTAGEPARISATLEPTDKPGIVTVRALQGEILRGTFTSRPFLLRLSPPAAQTVLHLRNLDLARVSELVGSKSLTMTGQVKGSLPLSLTEKNGLTIKRGLLESEGSGTLRYAPKEAPDFLSGKAMKDTRTALKDFPFDNLGLSLDGPVPGGPLSAQLVLTPLDHSASTAITLPMDTPVQDVLTRLFPASVSPAAGDSVTKIRPDAHPDQRLLPMPETGSPSAPAR